MSLKKTSRRKFLLGSAAAIAAPGVVGLITGRSGVETGELREDSLWMHIPDNLTP